MYDIIIIGMGIGGITAGIYAKRAGLNVLMFEKNMPGGILQKINKITNYPGYDEISGVDLAMNLLKQVNSLQIPYKMEEVIDLEVNEDTKKVITNKGEYLAKKVIIATGRTPKYLGLDKEKDYLGRGISTCATCDGFLYKGEDIAVVGSGNSALSESLYLAKLAHTVYLLHRGMSFKGEQSLIDEVKKTPNIIIKNGVNIQKINENNGKIASIILDNNEVINVKGIFVYIGYKPDTKNFQKLNITNINGDIIVNESRKTAIDGVYAVGDCIKKSVYQLVTAASDGATAIYDLDK